MSSSTEEQERVIQNMDKNTMVIACPGSGKSFTMKEGTKAIFQRHPLARVSLVTFTRAATDSLKNSLQKMIEPRFLNRIEVDTFHGFIKKNGKPDRLERRASNRTQTNGDGITGTKTS
ncbi:TPA: UvrD-helicase domain-containing protein [Klebsiella variicola]